VAGVAPFSKKDAEGIRRASALLFGGCPVRNPAFREIEREYGAGRSRFYAYLADLFLSGIDRERGTIVHWPFPGTLLDQPAGTRQAWMIMQGSYFEKIKADMERLSR
jgi:hypothetical protein